MSGNSKQEDWTKPAGLAIPKGGFFKDKVEQGRYGPIFPKSPACYGFSILAKVIPGREDVFYKYAQDIEKTVAEQPASHPVLRGSARAIHRRRRTSPRPCSRSQGP